jgi:hypothetical protein
MAVVNAHILYCNKKQLPTSSCRLLDFLSLLFKEIAPKVTPASHPSSYLPCITLSRRNRSWWDSHAQLRTQGQHFPDALHSPRPQRANETREDPRRKCIYCCKKHVLTICKQCGVFLCLGRCFHEFHTLRDLNEQPEIDANSTPSSESSSD